MKTSNNVGGAAPERNHGLDTLRALAITLVFAYHYMVFVSRQPTFGWVSEVGWVGVDLFFVLSGYLIANQLFEGLVRGQQVSLKRFYARRALRTLPVFWVVLAVYFLWPTLMGGKTPPPLWRFLSFTQNYQLQPGTAFSHAWSLCIEEQFYLVFPLVLLIGARLRSGVSKGWALLVALMLLGITARAVLWLQYGRESTGQISGYHPNIYYATLCRFDEFLPGVAVAMLKNFHADAWARWMQRGQARFAWGTIAVLAALFCVDNFYEIADYGYGFFMTAFWLFAGGCGLRSVGDSRTQPVVMAAPRARARRLPIGAVVLLDLPVAQGHRIRFANPRQGQRLVVCHHADRHHSGLRGGWCAFVLPG
jgi:peptidoglycan/LPS O-acetylase OafA/YrhL